MNETERNRTINWIVTITIGLLVALLVGVLFGFHLSKRPSHRTLGIDGTKDVAVQQQAYIQFTLPDHGTDVSCTQYVGGLPPLGATLYARPSLSENNQDTIRWHGPLTTDTVTVTFQDSGPAGPFANTTYTSPNPSSAPTTAGQSDFSYIGLTITRGGTTYNCTNHQGMGVHISQ